MRWASVVWAERVLLAKKGQGIMRYDILRGGLLRTAVLGVGAGLLAIALAAPVTAQQAAPKAGAAPAAKDAKAAPAAAQPQQQGAWVKICDKVPVPKKTADGKEAMEEKGLCLTQHERLNATTGMPIISAAVREVEGQPQAAFLIMVPLGVALPPGMKAAVLQKDLWEKVSKGDKIDDKQLKPFDLQFVFCHPQGCTAEIAVSKELMDQMKSGGGLMVLVKDVANGQTVPLPVPLDGFGQTYSGPPVDNAAYAQARGQVMEQIRQNQIELLKKQQGQQPPAAPAAKQAPAPAAPPKK